MKKKIKPAKDIIMAQDDSRSQAAEAYRTLRTNLQYAGIDKPIQKLMIAGAIPSCGKTTTLVNLGLAFSKTGASVLRKKIGALGFRNIAISFCKIFSASIVMGVIARVIFNYLNITLSQNLSLLLAMVVGAATYFVLIYFMKIDDVDAVVKAVRKRIDER